ncbi:tetratricopeptide repeat protein [Catalinimonas alkaloidigena]|uniref:tetratricopeptide repeat protein n=1 Tax=Catalinimonas alkaloidigena TaxID=1075417 RepID=UPI000B7EF418|nr:tetratricopeptide repeat protein [Catalinimonas alkaloidigena]
MLPTKWSVCWAIAISLGSLCTLRAQTAAWVQVQADSLFAAGHYAEAIPLYDRLLFFEPEASHVAQSNLHLAISYFETGQFERAAYYYDAAYFAATSDSLQESILLEKSLSYLLAQHPKEALIELLSLPETAEPYRRQVFLGLTYFLLTDYDQAEVAFAAIFPDTCLTSVQEVLDDARRTDRRYRAARAQFLSALLPGLGQAYIGDWRSSANSLVINGAFAYLFVATALNYSWLSAAMSVLPWLQRYYIGGIKKVGVLARDRGANRRQDLYRELVDLLPQLEAACPRP